MALEMKTSLPKLFLSCFVSDTKSLEILRSDKQEKKFWKWRKPAFFVIMVVTIAFSSTKPEKNLVNDISEKSTYYIII